MKRVLDVLPGLALIGVGLLVLGCGGGGDPTPSKVTTQPYVRSTTVTPTATTTPPRKPLVRPRKTSPSPTHRPTTTRSTPRPTTPAPRPTTVTAVYYANCTELRKDHPDGVQKGQPGYRSGLDRDRDNTACESTA